VIRRIAWERVVAGAAALFVAVALDGTDAIVTLSVVIGILVASIAVETVRLREIRAVVKAG
jgi:hypothetical protein